MAEHPRLLVFRAIFLCCLLQGALSDLLPFGTDNGDIQLIYDGGRIDSVQINLSFPMPFLGPGLVSQLHVSSVGTVSYTTLQKTNLEELTSNVVMTPFMAQVGSGGNIYYRQTDTDIAVFSQVSSLLADQGVVYNPVLALVVTWENMPSPDDASLVNSYQLVVTTSGEKSYVMMNYEGSLMWTSAGKRMSYAGVFSAGEVGERCGQPLQNSGTDQIWTLAETSTKSTNVGQHIMDITSPLECFSFESPCGETPALGRTRNIPYFENSNENFLGWNFYLEITCKTGLSIREGVSSQRLFCRYEPDYYEYAWDMDIKECVDLGATRKFEVSMSGLNLGGLAGASMDVIREKLLPEIMKMLRAAGITDVIIQIDELVPQKEFRAGDISDLLAQLWDVKFTVFSPTYANRKLSGGSLMDKLMTVIATSDSEMLSSAGVSVAEKTDKCLQDCICYIREKSGKNCHKRGKVSALKPDACCGGCNGKSYASSKKVCCAGKHIYDPSRSVCCDGRVKRGTSCPAA